MVSPGRPQPAYPLAPCHLTPCPVGDRPGALLRRVQERTEIFQFGDQSVLGGDHTFGAFALALVVRPVPGRALLLGGKLGFELLILAFSVATTSVTGWPRGDRADKGLCRSSSRSIANKVLPSSAAASPSSRRPPNDHRSTVVTFDRYDRVAPHCFVNMNA
jgi:hypothetical protein